MQLSKQITTSLLTHVGKANLCFLALQNTFRIDDSSFAGIQFFVPHHFSNGGLLACFSVGSKSGERSYMFSCAGEVVWCKQKMNSFLIATAGPDHAVASHNRRGRSQSHNRWVGPNPNIDNPNTRVMRSPLEIMCKLHAQFEIRVSLYKQHFIVFLNSRDSPVLAFWFVLREHAQHWSKAAALV